MASRASVVCPLTCGPSKGVGTTEAPVWQLDILNVEEDNQPAVTAELESELLNMEEDQQPTFAAEHAADDDLATDDVHGGPLPADLVKLARKEEMNYIHSRKIYKYGRVADHLPRQ